MAGASLWRWNGWREIAPKFHYSSPVPAPDALCGRRLDLLTGCCRADCADCRTGTAGQCPPCRSAPAAAEFTANFHFAPVAQNVVHFVLAQALQHGRDPLAAALAVK